MRATTSTLLEIFLLVPLRETAGICVCPDVSGMWEEEG